MGFSTAHSRTTLSAREFRYQLSCGHVKTSGTAPPVAEGDRTWCWTCHDLAEVLDREATGNKARVEPQT